MANKMHSKNLGTQEQKEKIEKRDMDQTNQSNWFLGETARSILGGDYGLSYRILLNFVSKL